MRSYLVKWMEGNVPHQEMVVGLQRAKQLKDQHGARVFIADGKNTESLDGTEVFQFDDDDED